MRGKRGQVQQYFQATLLVIVFALLAGCASSKHSTHLDPDLAGPAAAREPTVLVFLSPDCPCSVSHEVVLKRLANKFPKVRFLGVYSGPEVAVAQSHFKDGPLPMIYDSEYRLADRYGALKTPHVFLFNRSHELVFQGGICDSRDASRARHNYLEAALSAVNKGLDPEIRETKTLGCYIRK